MWVTIPGGESMIGGAITSLANLRELAQTVIKSGIIGQEGQKLRVLVVILREGSENFRLFGTIQAIFCF